MSADPSRLWLVSGALLGALTVAAGAFGAHALRGALDARAMEIYQTAVQYQGWHALALLGLAALGQRLGQQTGYRMAGWAFLAGTFLFSGSLYALALGAPRALGMITPIGGTLFIFGWCFLGWTGYQAKSWR